MNYPKVENCLKEKTLIHMENRDHRITCTHDPVLKRSTEVSPPKSSQGAVLRPSF